MDKIALIIPAYNEAEVIRDTLQDIRQLCKRERLGQVDIVVVDDGSTDGSGQIATNHADYILTHRRNCGLGASLATGIEYAKRHDYDYLITFDSDGQHDPRDIKKALVKMRSGYDIVIGSRFIGTYSDMPRGRRVLLTLSNYVTYLFFGVWTTDSQSGFRGLSKRAIREIRIKSNRMEVSSEFFGEIKRLGLKFCEIPIHIRYTEYSLRKGQTNSHGAGVLLKLLYNLFR